MSEMFVDDSTILPAPPALKSLYYNLTSNVDDNPISNLIVQCRRLHDIDSDGGFPTWTMFRTPLPYLIYEDYVKVY